jgi:hypothetical protein
MKKLLTIILLAFFMLSNFSWAKTYEECLVDIQKECKKAIIAEKVDDPNNVLYGYCLINLEKSECKDKGLCPA